MPERNPPVSPVGQYIPLRINAVSLPVNTTSATTITGGATVVTPASMTNIVVGTQLYFSGGTGAAETVVVTATTSTTFTATFANGHSGAYTITTPASLVYIPVGRTVSTSSATTITAGAGVVVTPASVKGMYVGQRLNIAGGTGAAEDVEVKGINPSAGTFTADFANNHSGNYIITSRSGTFLGRVAIGTTNGGGTLTLYNGSPNLSPLPSDSGIFAVIDTTEIKPYEYGCACDYGLFYTYTLASGTPADVTLLYTDMSV